MGKITLNGEPVEVSADKPSLLELVAEVEREHIEDGWIIVEVTVDGKEVEGFTEDDGSLILYSSDQSVNVVTRKTSEIQVGILERFETYLKRLIPVLREIVGLFRSGQTELANKLYSEAVEGLLALIEHVQGIRGTLQLDEGGLTEDGRDLDDLAGELKGTLEELVAAQEAKDNERIADALEFELVDQLQTWCNILPELRTRIIGSESG